ncbi:FRG domain-containing protein [Vibrio vulnificus]|uniref:FRG domain-containing protein n=1 Tax=Vibrio vulnificus TaxID=672 RepID=UPI0002D9793E|nr:FRG domain-containing protein [Vibrio vulnificus]EHH0708691.1 FRG domain-containing protein [Vibrio vulnificus]EHH1183487.1 FRG domain-containing protein [Vibrio vulnificus]EHH2485469.1 FRG domain-containing protein [Vibrio vulnificus]EHU4794238.1 FRG domain-containing protein [Vibrio vulnificus]EHU4866540.1 FRG domain-containing protein [Vibrio vulnificus]
MTVAAFEVSKIPVWNSENPERSFDIVPEQPSGRIPVTRIEHWRDFSSLLESPFFNRVDEQFIFRGHRRFDWEMTPTLARVTQNGIVTEDIAKRQLEMFRKAIRGRISDHSLLDDEDEREADELWSIGQHHGLMTPLLDWTYSPYVALFFAFAKEDQPDEKDNPYRAVYILNKTFIADDELCPDIRVFEPKKDDHGRLVSQAGLFTFSPYDATIENKLTEVLTDEDFPDDELKTATEGEQAGILAKYICKVYIRNEEQQECLKHLRRMNVHHASLFPDLIGAADYCNIFMAELEREKALQQRKVDPVREPVIVEAGQPEQPSRPVEKNAGSILELLKSTPESQEVEPNRIQLIADELNKYLSKSMVVDWQARETVQAEMKNATRVLLRKYGYPVNARDTIVENILDVVGGGSDQ